MTSEEIYKINKEKVLRLFDDKPKEFVEKQYIKLLAYIEGLESGLINIEDIRKLKTELYQ